MNRGRNVINIYIHGIHGMCEKTEMSIEQLCFFVILLTVHLNKQRELLHFYKPVSFSFY